MVQICSMLNLRSSSAEHLLFSNAFSPSATVQSWGRSHYVKCKTSRTHEKKKNSKTCYTFFMMKILDTKVKMENRETHKKISHISVGSAWGFKNISDIYWWKHSFVVMFCGSDFLLMVSRSLLVLKYSLTVCVSTKCGYREFWQFGKLADHLYLPCFTKESTQ